jgi:hypothetical protein
MSSTAPCNQDHQLDTETTAVVMDTHIDSSWACECENESRTAPECKKGKLHPERAEGDLPLTFQVNMEYRIRPRNLRVEAAATHPALA